MFVMKAEKLFKIIGSEFYTGVPDSQLKALCNFLMDKYGIDEKHHIIAANEGNCLALAAGYHLATSKIPRVPPLEELIVQKWESHSFRFDGEIKSFP